LRPIPHAIQIFHNTRHGFYILTKDGSQIIKHIERNPFVTLSLNQNEGKLAIAQCTAHISSDKAFISEVWSNDQIQFGNSGSNDPELRAILISIHSVINEGKTLDGVSLDESLYSQIQAETDEVNSGPFQTEQAIEILSQLFSIGQPVHLITFSGLGHNDRIITIRYKQGIGLFAVSSFSTNKVKEIQTDSNIALFYENKADNIQIIINAKAHPNKSPEVKKQ
ncbi:MAG: hypothetical protein EZS28_054488, partial [Streblomastix strix]